MAHDIWRGSNVIKNWIIENGYRYTDFVALIEFRLRTSAYIGIFTTLTLSLWVKNTSYFNCEKKKISSGYFSRISKSRHISILPNNWAILNIFGNSMKKFKKRDKVGAVFWNSYFEHEFPTTFKIYITLYYKRDSHLQITFTTAMHTVQTRILREMNGVTYTNNTIYTLLQLLSSKCLWVFCIPVNFEREKVSFCGFYRNVHCQINNPMF